MSLPAWKSIEIYIDKNLAVGSTFTSRDYAASVGVSSAIASRHIQSYLTAQRGADATCKYILKRQPGTRTRNAVWSIGDRARDIRVLGLGFSNDTKTKWKRAVEPDIRRIAAVNPLAARRAEILIDAVFDGALKVLEAAVKT